ncbi:MAG: M43 family zinc metalloprotease [Flavobacteriales bacterium]|nr:M43 family zinc metalloprotease [Flavobacteriales bacterium]
MKKHILFTLTLVLFFSSLHAQHWCGAVQNQNTILENRPELKEEIEKKERFFNQLQKNQSEKRLENEDPYIIPVVFHVIYEDEADNISLAQIEDQMRIINEDFARLNADTTNTPSVFAKYAGDTNIQFRLAKLDPDGLCTQGVTRTYSHETYKAAEQIKELIQWSPKNYLNIWVVNKITFEIPGMENAVVLGYAQFPTLLNSSPKKDGIVLRGDQCGSVGTAAGHKGRTLTHEIGHWLNLIHIWGDEECGDDSVNDTPTAKDKNGGCPTFPWAQERCKKKVSNGQTIEQESGEMFMNYMDYTVGSCQNMFSLGQGERMRSAVRVYRSEIASDDNLVKTGTNDNYGAVTCAPIAEFRANNRFICSGDEVQYTNTSYNAKKENISSFEWVFEGGTPSHSTEENPAVVYNEHGIFKTSLKVSNQAGQYSLVKEAFLYVSKETAGIPAPYIQNFGTDVFAEDNGFENWGRSASKDASWTQDASLSSKTLKIRSGLFSKPGEKHMLVSPSFDLTNANETVAAYFDIAHAKRNGNSEDQLIVYVSSDCGKTWQKKWDKDTGELSTFGPGNVYVNYTPEPEHWDQFNINLSSFQGEENVKFKFEFFGKEGNWLYLDNFVITDSTTLELHSNSISELKLYPNPSKGDVTLEFELFENAEVELSLTNIYGAVIAQETRKLKATLNRVSLKDIKGDLSAGVYFVQLSHKNYKRIEKLIITN